MITATVEADIVCKTHTDDLAVCARKLNMTFPNGQHKHVVLDQLSIEIGRGESVILAGPSGSGKTTLLSILGCLLTPTSGRLKLLGQDASKYNSEAKMRFRRTKLGFVFQRFNLIRGLTAIDNVSIPMILANSPPQKVQERAMQLLDSVGLADFADSSINNLSGGQCQRIAIARALANSPELILADEPTASLDIESGQNVMNLLCALTKQQGATLVTVTHDSRIFNFARRIIHLENGRTKEVSLKP